MPAAAPQRVVIVGGGLEGWTSAAGLAQSLQGSGTTVTVLEIPGLTNVEPAQYTLPQTLDFLRQLGLSNEALVRDAGATFRLGTELRNLCQQGDIRIRPFGPRGANIGFIRFHHYLARCRLGGDESDFNDYSPNAIAARSNRIGRDGEDADARLPVIEYGLTCNTDKLIELLRAVAIDNGVVTVEGEPAETRVDSETGRIDAVILKDGRDIGGDLFVDCTGEAALLIGEALGVRYVDWSHWLPCDRKVSVATRGRPYMPPLLRCVAQDSGWIVQVPLRHRTASMLLYSSECMEDETASNELIRFLGSATAEALAFGASRSGHRQRFWESNCVAVGSSAGRVEPLDVSDLHLVQSAVARLLGLLPTARLEPQLAIEYNRTTQLEYEGLRDYQMINYFASEWRDAVFWKRARGADTLESFRTRLDLFRSRGRITAQEYDPYSRDDWVAAYLAANIWPGGYDPLLDSMDADRLRAHFDAMRHAIQQAVQAMPSHDVRLEELGR